VTFFTVHVFTKDENRFICSAWLKRQRQTPARLYIPSPVLPLVSIMSLPVEYLLRRQSHILAALGEFLITIGPFTQGHSEPLSANMTSSMIPEVHNVPSRRETTTEPYSHK